MDYKNRYDVTSMYGNIVNTITNNCNTTLANGYRENDGTIYDGTESFTLLNKAFYKIDKAMQSGIKGTIGYFSSVNVCIDNLATYNTKTPNIRTMYRLKDTLQSHIKDGAKFYKISDKKAPVLTGFNITLPKLYDILNSNVNYVRGLEDVMVSFNSMLEDIINSKKDNIVINVDKDDVKAIDKSLELINKDLNTVTNNKVLSDRKPVKELIGNYKELSKLVDNSLKLGNEYKMERLETIYSINDEIVMKLEVIYNSIKNNDTKMDKNDLKEFILYINVIAKYVTAIAFLFYLYYQILNMQIAIIKIADITKEDSSVIDTIALQIKKGNNIIRSFMSEIVG